MASSNVDYYQKQKDLQDKMHARYTFDKVHILIDKANAICFLLPVRIAYFVLFYDHFFNTQNIHIICTLLHVCLKNER